MPEQTQVELDARITRALEVAPQVEVPADFAAKVAAAVPPRRPASQVALWVSRAACAVLLAAMFLAAPWALGRTPLSLTVEFLLAAELIAVTLWLTLRQNRLTQW